MARRNLALVLPRLLARGTEIGSVVEFEPMAGARQGYYELDSRRIAIRKEMSANAQVKTPLAELVEAVERE